MMTPAGRKLLDELRQAEADPLQLSLPWGGRSPRVLTRSYQRFTLEAQDDDANGFFDDEVLDDQYRRFNHGS